MEVCTFSVNYAYARMKTWHFDGFSFLGVKCLIRVGHQMLALPPDLRHGGCLWGISLCWWVLSSLGGCCSGFNLAVSPALPSHSALWLSVFLKSPCPRPLTHTVAWFVTFLTYVTHRADIFLEAFRDLRAFCSQGLGSLPRDRPLAPPQQLLPRTRRHRESWTCITGTYHDAMGGKIRAELLPLQPLQLSAHANGHRNGQ